MSTGLMQAVVKAEARPGAELRRVPIPEVGPNEVLVRVVTASVCGTDLHIYEWDQWSSERIRLPLVFGHEFFGVVEKVGTAVRTVEKGERISAEMHVNCGRCYQCRTAQGHICQNLRIIGIDCDGCFAEFVRVPETNVWKIEPSIPRELGALLDPLGNAVHAVLISEIAGLSVAITGCGPIGLMAIGVARACGAGPIFASEVHHFRSDLAKRVGATSVVDPIKTDPVDFVLSQTNGFGVDVVLEMSGDIKAIRQAFQMVRRGGRVSLLGIPQSAVQLELAKDVILKGVTIHGIHGRRLFKTWYQMNQLLKAEALDLSPLITHRLPLSDIARAMELLHSGSACKILLYPENSLALDFGAPSGQV